MVFQVFIALLFLTAALGLHFVPRNRHVGFRTRHTLSSDTAWTKTNRFAAVLFLLAGSALLYFSNRGISNEDFYFAVFICIAAIAFLGLRYGLSIARNIHENAPKSPPKGKNKKGAKAEPRGMVFSESKKISIFYSLFCALLTGVSYIWLIQCLAFMPDDMAVYNRAGEAERLGFTLGEYSAAARFSFFAALIVCAAAFIIAANLRKLRPSPPQPYSLRVPLSDIFFAYAASLALLLSTANYAFYRSAASSRAGSDDVFTMALPLLGIVAVWFALFKISGRAAKNG